MDYKTLIVNAIPQGMSVTLNRFEQRNSLNALIIQELYQVLDEVEKNAACRILVIQGQQGIFCTGMDFHEAAQGNKAGPSDAYQGLLKRFASISKVVITLVDGQVMAGGIGLVAASDLVIATPRSQFTLTEAMWGLLPANLMPYLIRRVGFQKAYFMTLTMLTLTAEEAYKIYLVDELSEKPEESLRKLTLRLARLDEKTILEMKQYFRKMWIINESMEYEAIQELTQLMQQPRIQNNIKRFVEQGKFPWEVTHE